MNYEEVIYYVKQVEREDPYDTEFVGKPYAEEVLMDEDNQQISFFTYEEARKATLERAKLHIANQVKHPGTPDLRNPVLPDSIDQFKLVDEGNCFHLFWREAGWKDIVEERATDIFKLPKETAKWSIPTIWVIEIIRLPQQILNTLKLVHS